MATDNLSFEERFWSKVDKSDPSGCWLWTAFIHQTGYGYLRSGGKTLKAHRVSYTLAYGPIPDGLHVCHHCDVRHCVRPDHLFAGTDKDNHDDCVRKGRACFPDFSGDKNYNRINPPRGELGTNVKLNNAKVRAIRAEYQPRGAIGQSFLARKYGVSVVTIDRIVNRRSWSHLPDKEPVVAPICGQWQPIETAPKERNLLLTNGRIVCQGGWVSETDQGAEYEGQGSPSAGWWSVDFIDAPTHWTPLPDPPTASRC